jgi:YD repeat-containing protein
VTQTVVDVGVENLTSTYAVDTLGRTTEYIEPDSHITATVYLDTQHEVRTYPGWNSATGLTTDPIEVTRDDRGQGYSESFTMATTPGLGTNGLSNGSEAISGLQSLSRTYYNIAGQAVRQDHYFNLAGLAYSTNMLIGVSGVNYYTTRSNYDADGRDYQTIAPTGTITQTLYTALGEVASTWIGTSLGNLVQLTSNVYDSGGVGDGNQTRTTQYVGGGAPADVSDMFYDWRDRQIAQLDGVGGASSFVSLTTFDNLDEVTQEQQYNGQGAIISNGTVTPQSSMLRAQTTSAYDPEGQVYQTQTFDINPANGVGGPALTTKDYYDDNGNLIAQQNPGGTWTKYLYNGAGEVVSQYTTDGAGGTSYAAAATVAGDRVLEQTDTLYDNDGNPILVTTRQRFNTDTGLGGLGTPTTGNEARVSYVGYYYDLDNRLIATANAGTNGGNVWTRPASVPASSSTLLVSVQSYNGAGLVDTTTDPQGIQTKTYYDAAGRVTKTIQDYTNGVVTNNSNQTTEYGYDGDGNRLWVQIDLPGGAVQKTQYVYGVSTASGSA